MQKPAETLVLPAVLPAEKLPNRLAKAAMTEGLADAQGRATVQHLNLYRAWARGGAGLLITGNVIIDRHHLERPGNVVIDAEPDADARRMLEAWAQTARAQGAGFWMQISHAGRQTMRPVNQRPKAPSAVRLQLPGNRFAVPEPLTEAEIKDLVARFARAVRVARETGFTGAQIHAAHGYLISQFLSPRANQRTDQWGGPLENRARFLLEIVRASRVAAGAGFTLAVKLNSADFQRGGFGPQDSLQVAEWLQAEGVDVLEISGGTYEQPRMMMMEGMEAPDTTGMAQSTREREAYFVDFATEMQARVRIPLMVTGGFRTASAMAEAIVANSVSIIGLARPLCVEPDGPAQLLGGLAALKKWEDTLRIGPGWLGPRSPLKLIKALNGFGATYWHYQQIRLLGDGKAPDPSLGLLKALQAEEKQQAAHLAASAAFLRSP
jgi:2,4-dienoyl-CoA reductase-like NADH-dependent reductase (Old Yellow Enzyme family)